MKCLDSTVLASLALEEDADGLKHLLKEESITLDLAFIETLNVIWKRVYLFGEITSAAEPLRRLEILHSLICQKQAWNYRQFAVIISKKYGLPVYDSLFIACAISENAELVTLDRKQKRVYNAVLNNSF